MHDLTTRSLVPLAMPRTRVLSQGLRHIQCASINVSVTERVFWLCLAALLLFGSAAAKRYEVDSAAKVRDVLLGDDGDHVELALTSDPSECDALAACSSVVL